MGHGARLDEEGELTQAGAVRRYVVDAESGEPGQLGGKAAALARLRDAGLPIPEWVAVSPAAFEASLSDAQRDELARAEGGSPAHRAEAAQTVLMGLRPAEEVAAELRLAVERLAPNGELLAVRSSAPYEDAAQQSFAGQLESFLNVASAEAATAVADVWRSGFSARIFAYRAEHGLQGMPSAPAVLIQRMVKADAAGVAFSADPVSGRRSVAVVAAVTGTGEGLVAGERDADSWRVGRDGEILERNVQRSDSPVLGDGEVRAVAELARQVEREAGRPQDIEWAIEGDKLFLLQARPVTALAQLADPDGARLLWDNSNIIESYGGMTTPLTYTFARRAYNEVYQELCRILGVPDRTIQANRAVFGNMIGLVRGRIYYNLLNWYRVLAMLPGFKANRRFMEQMMGVREGLPDEVADALAHSSWRQRMADRLYLARTVAGLAGAYLTLDRRIRRFYARLNAALGEGRPDLSGRRADELVAYYWELDSKLLHKWDAPLVNDFFAMIFYGLLRGLAVKWCGDEGGTLQNDLLTGEGGMVSAEPAARVRSLARRAREAETQTPGFVELLRTGMRGEIERVVEDAADFRDEYEAYLAQFGDRCLNELKLESLTLHDDPLPLLRAVGQLAAHPAGLEGGDLDMAVRNRAEARADSALAGKPLRKAAFRWVLRNARARVRDRENLRFERTRVFGRARQVLAELGRRFYAADALDRPRDVFYLTLDEVLGFVEGATASADLRGLAQVRAAEFARYAEMPAPASRFATVGAVHQGNAFQAAGEAAAPEPGGEAMTGIGCCPGVVRGRARVVSDPLTAQLEPGDIVVAEHTDPSWILILPLAAGLVVERGSLLSHAAIVARELGIPAVVSLAGVTRWLRDGETVVLDGSTGVVRRERVLELTAMRAEVPE